MRQSNIIKVILSFLCLISLTACSNSSEASDYSNQYITLTFTHVTDVEDEYEMNTYEYDMTKQEATLISKIPYESQYPLSYYDKDDNIVYYSHNIDNGDELYSYNCDTKESKRLTKGLYAINSIIKVSDHELALAAVASEVNVSLWIYNINNGEIKNIDMDDFNISSMSYLYNSKKLILAGYSSDEEWKIRDDYNNELIDNYSYPSTFYEYDIDTGEKEEIFQETEGEINSIAASEDYIYYKISGFLTADTKVIQYDRKNKKRKEKTDMKEIYSFIGMSNDSKELIYIGNISKGDSFMEKMNTETNKIESLFVPDNMEGQINNGVLVSLI